MSKVIIGFSYSNGLMSRVIRFMTNSNVSHVYVKIPVTEYNENMVFHASEFNVHYCNYNIFTKKHKVVEEYEIGVSSDTASLGEMMRVIETGKQYSIRDIMGLIWVLAMRGLGVHISNPFRKGSQSFISVEFAMLSIGEGLDNKNTTPEEFRRWCEKNGILIYKFIEQD